MMYITNSMKACRRNERQKLKSPSYQVHTQKKKEKRRRYDFLQADCKRKWHKMKAHPLKMYKSSYKLAMGNKNGWLRKKV